MYKKILLILLVFAVRDTNAQLEARQWYFGGNAGLDFTTSPPAVISNTNLNTSGGMATMSDANGNLLFYTDGQTVWNKQHQVMANGTGLSGNVSGLQNVVIVPDFQNGLYDVLTVSPLLRTVVDMNLAAGLGSVTVKNLTTTPQFNTIKSVSAGIWCTLMAAITRNAEYLRG